MSKDFLLSGYTITTDPDFMDDQNALSPQLKWQLEKFHKLALEGKKSNVPKLLEAIERHPDNPQLKNYLSVLYTNIGDKQKAFETNHWIVAEHPGYLFGKLNLANEHYLKGEYEKMPEILGEAMEIKALYPHRNTFHLNEVVSFYKCAVLYFTAIGNIDQAEIRFDIMKELDPDSSDTEMALQSLVAARLELGWKRFEEDEKKRISVKTKQQGKKNTTTAPKFENPETEWLYTNGLYIGKEKLDKLLALPRE
jgi:tetratricopeptide (TPR) repeat protein